MSGIIINDPCYYCGRELSRVVKEGCGSEEFPKSAVDKWCMILSTARQQNDVQDNLRKG